MTNITINGVTYPAKTTLGAIKRACNSLGCNSETEIFGKGIIGISAIVYESLVACNKDLGFTMSEFEDMLTVTDINNIFIQLNPPTEGEGDGSPNVL